MYFLFSPFFFTFDDGVLCIERCHCLKIIAFALSLYLLAHSWTNHFSGSSQDFLLPLLTLTQDANCNRDFPLPLLSLQCMFLHSFLHLFFFIFDTSWKHSLDLLVLLSCHLLPLNSCQFCFPVKIYATCISLI